MKNVDQILSEKFEVKNLKTLNTSDGIAYTASIYANSVKICDVENQGWGGETMFDMSEESEKIFNSIIQDNNIKKMLLDSRYNFMETIDKISNEIILSEIIETAIILKKFNSDVKRHQKKAIVYGVYNADSFQVFKFKYDLELIVNKGYKGKIQEEIDKIKKGLKPGERILNTNLQKLGLTV
jgi:hypothetical protein